MRLVLAPNRNFAQLRTSSAVRADMRRRAAAAAAALGEGFEAVETVSPRNRARAAVVTSSRAGRLKASQNPAGVVATAVSAARRG